MKLSVNQIKRETANGTFSFHDVVNVAELETMNNDIRSIEAVDVQGDCTIHGEQLFVSFIMKGTMILPCARTLADVLYPFEIKALEMFSLSDYYGNGEDDEIHAIDGETLDLMPYIKENILLEVPYRVFSDDAASKDNAMLKGDGWDFVSEADKKKSIDPRLQKLESLLNKNKKEK